MYAEESVTSSNKINTESDRVAASACECIPFIDIVCDFVGSIAAVGFESNVVILSAQSAIDYVTTVSTKEQEDIDVAELNSIESEFGADTDIASRLTSKAKEKHIKSESELNQSNT